MRLLIKLAVILLLLAGIVYGALYGYLWYTLQKEVETRVAQLQPLAAINYRALTLSPTLSGSMSIEGIVIKPVGVSDQITVQSIKLDLPGAIALFKGVLEMKEQKLPDQLHLSISGMAADLNGPFISGLDHAMKQARPAQEGHKLDRLLDFDALGCGNVVAIGLEELTHMGYQKLELDGDLDYRYARRQDDLTFSMILRGRGIYSLDIKGRLRGEPSMLLKGKDALPHIDELRVDYVDSGYTMLRNRFCAAQLDSTEENFKRQHIEALSEALDASFSLELVESYLKFLAGNGRFALIFNPESGQHLAKAADLTLQEGIAPLGLGFLIDNQEVNLKMLDWGKRYNLEVMRQQRAERLARQSGSADTSPESKRPRFRPTSVAQLHNHIGSHVQLTTGNGQLREGVIDSIDREIVTLRVYHAKGKGYISYPIPLDDIATAQVFY